MKKLFTVKNNKGRVYVNAYYEDKQDAKGVRNALNEEGGKHSPYTVSKGPDHYKYGGV